MLKEFKEESRYAEYYKRQTGNKIHQAKGRARRHSLDYGVVIYCDTRYRYGDY